MDIEYIIDTLDDDAPPVSAAGIPKSLYAVPAELRRSPQWVAWRSDEKKDGTKAKVPYRPDGRGRARTNDRSTWGTFEAAVAAFRDPAGAYDGVGFVFAEDDPYVGIDFDGCLDGRMIADWAEGRLRRFKVGYVEVSPSGKGIKVWCRGRLPGPGGARKVGGGAHTGVEAYDRGRFFAVTGDVLSRPEGEIPDLQVDVDELYAWIKERPTDEPTRGGAATPPRSTAASEKGERTPEGRASAYLAKVDPAVSGEHGHSMTLRAAMVGPAFDLPPDVAYRLLRDEYNPRCVPPWPEKDLRRKVDEAYRIEARRGWLLDAGRASGAVATQAAAPPGERERGLDAELAGVARTDMGNATRLAVRNRGLIRYCKPWGGWLVWDGCRYAVDRTGAAMRSAKEAVRRILAEAATIQDDEERKAHAAWALASQGKARLDAMLALAASEPGVPATPEEMDRDGWLLNCRNGTIDLRTGGLRPHDRADLITRACPIDFDPDAKAPTWEATLDLFFAGNRELIAYFQRICGYALVGVIRDHVLIVAYGDGSNGKSTILGTLLDVLGRDYAMKAPPNLLMAKAHEAHPTDRADLFGKRLVVAIETGEGRRLDETTTKELTGGDVIRARRMREDFWEFAPTHTLIMATNHKPEVRGGDNGIWRRLRLIPFAVKVDGSKADASIPEKLKLELPGVLAWCVRGCLAWREVGLAEPEDVASATAEYRSEQDVVGRFLDERCLLAPAVRERCSRVYEAFKAWADRSGERSMSLRQFGDAMKRRGVETRTSNGKWYLGVGLKPSDDGAFEDGPGPRGG